MLHKNLNDDFLHYFNTSDIMAIILKNETALYVYNKEETIKIIIYNMRNFSFFSNSDQIQIVETFHNLISSYNKIILKISSSKFNK